MDWSRPHEAPRPPLQIAEYLTVLRTHTSSLGTYFTRKPCQHFLNAKLSFGLLHSHPPSTIEIRDTLMATKVTSLSNPHDWSLYLDDNHSNKQFETFSPRQDHTFCAVEGFVLPFLSRNSRIDARGPIG